MHSLSLWQQLLYFCVFPSVAFVLCGYVCVFVDVLVRDPRTAVLGSLYAIGAIGLIALWLVFWATAILVAVVLLVKAPAAGVFAIFLIYTAWERRHGRKA